MPEHLGNVLEADEQVFDHLALEVPGDPRHQAGRHFRLDDDRRARHPPLLGQLSQLEMRQQGSDLVAGHKLEPSLRSPVLVRLIPLGIMAPSRSASGSVESTRSALEGLCQGGGPVHGRGHLGIGGAGDVGKQPVGRHLLLDRRDAETLLDQHLQAGHRADAVQRREDDLDLVEAGRRQQALPGDQFDVGPVRPVVEEMDAPLRGASVQGSSLMIVTWSTRSAMI